MLYLTNAFALSMVPQTYPCGITCTPITAEEAADLLDQAVNDPGEQGWLSCVGHTDTANVFETILTQAGKPVYVRANRVTLALDINYDHMLVGQYIGPRLPEGATTLPDGATIQWFHLEFHLEFHLG